MKRGLSNRRTLTIANGAASASDSIYFDDAERIGIIAVLGPSALTQTCRLAHSVDGTNFYPVTINGTATAVAAVGWSFFDVTMAGWYRIQTASGNEGADRAFVVYCLAQPI